MNPEVTRQALAGFQKSIREFSIEAAISRGISPRLAQAELEALESMVEEFTAELASLRCSVCGGTDETVRTPDADEDEPRWETPTLCRSCAENAGEDSEETR
jgi:hypothetical protein